MRRFAFLLSPAWRGVWTGVGCTAVVWYLTTMSVFVGMEDWMLDGAFISRGKRPTKTKVVLVAIDERSLRELRKSTTQISPELALVVRHAHAQGAAAIGVDLFVPDDMKEFADGASQMGAAIRDCGNVVLPRWRVRGEAGAREEWLYPLAQWRLKALDVELASDTDLASIHLVEDGDQFVRRVQPLARETVEIDGKAEDFPIVHFALALWLIQHKEPLRIGPDGAPLAGDRPIPTDRRGLMPINYVGPPGSFPTVQFHKALAAAKKGEAMPELDGAVVLIGVTAPSMQDYHPTPYANHHARWWHTQQHGQMAGTEVIANAYATIEDGAYVRSPGKPASLLLLLFFGVTMGYALYRAGLAGGLFIAAAHHFLWKAVALTAFVLFAYRLPVVGMLLLGTILYAATFALRWRQTRRIWRAFMATAIADWFEKDPSRIHRTIAEREVTVLFADVRGFSTYSDGRPPREVASLLMAYFDVIVPIIERHGGAVNLFMGDGIMVLFNATHDQPDHAVRAVRAAVDMVRAVRADAVKWAKLGKPDMRIGVGINTGATVVGTIGARHLLDFTAIGDTTNMAARIEAHNKETLTEILISGDTYEEVPAAEREALGCDPRPLSFVPRGKSGPIVVHAVNVAPVTNAPAERP